MIAVSRLVRRPAQGPGAGEAGLTLIEMMVAITIGMILVAALLALFVNTARTNNEMAKSNAQIENGRFAMQLLAGDIAHAGFWGTYVPKFDNLGYTEKPADAPTAVPNPCLAYASWDTVVPNYRTNLIGIPVQSCDGDPNTCTAALAPAACTTAVANQRIAPYGTDVLVVRHAAPCITGSADTNCEADTAGKLYFQSSLCADGVVPIPGRPAGGSATTIQLAADAPSDYTGMTVTLIDVTGAQLQSRKIAAYNTTTKLATLSAAWSPVPNFAVLSYSILPTARAGATTSITLQAPPTAATPTNLYSGMTVSLTGGTGAGQSRTISTCAGNPYVCAISGTWTSPDATTTYSISEYKLDTSGLALHKMGTDCNAAAVADKRKFVSNIYYVRTYSINPGDGIPSLVRSSFDLSGGVPQHPAAEALVEGIEGFRVELGIDSQESRCAPASNVDYTSVVNFVDPALCTVNANLSANTLPTNRGDGISEGAFVRCTAAAPCTVAQLENAVAVKLFVLARNLQTSPGYTDAKTYCLGTANPDGTCPDPSSKVGPFNDGYKRHLFSTTVRLGNVSGRRESP